MEEHKCCRVCTKSVHRFKCRRRCSHYRDLLRQAYSIDCINDDPDIHPSQFCPPWEQVTLEMQKPRESCTKALSLLSCGQAILLHVWNVQSAVSGRKVLIEEEKPWSPREQQDIDIITPTSYPSNIQHLPGWLPVPKLYKHSESSNPADLAWQNNLHGLLCSTHEGW